MQELDSENSAGTAKLLVFETERLIAPQWEPQRDLEDAFAMYGDPEVMRFLGRTPQAITDLEEMRARLERTIAVYETNPGTGSWALEEKATGRVVGASLLKLLPDGDGNPTGDMEVGWHLARSAWGKGYATESARAAIHYGFNRLNLREIHAVVYKENTRSIAVTQRLGMISVGPTDKYYGVTVEHFLLRKGD